MLPEHVDEMLSLYRGYIGRCEYLNLKIIRCKEEYEWHLAHAADYIALSGGQANDGMPRGSTVGNPTERMGMTLASGYIPEAALDKQIELRELEREYREKIIVVHFVEAFMKGLTEKERWTIASKVFEGKTYREMILDHKETYGEYCSRDKLRELRKSAMKKIYEMAK